MGIMAVRAAAHRMTENLNGRFWNVLIVVRSTRFSKVLKFPGLICPGSVFVFGMVYGNVEEYGYGDLTIGETGSVYGNVIEWGDGMVYVFGMVYGNIEEYA